MGVLTLLVLILFTNVSCAFGINDYLFLLLLLFIVNNKLNIPNNHNIITPKCKLSASSKNAPNSIDMIYDLPKKLNQKNIISNSYDAHNSDVSNANSLEISKESFTPKNTISNYCSSNSTPLVNEHYIEKSKPKVQLCDFTRSTPFKEESSITKHINNFLCEPEHSDLNKTNTSSFNKITLIDNTSLGSTLTIMTNLCSVTGRVLLNTPQIIALKLEDNKIVYINKKFISFFSQ